VFGVEHREPLRRLEGEHVALVQSGAVLLTHEAVAIRLVQRPPGGGHLLSGPSCLGQTCIDQIDMRLLFGQLALDRAGVLSQEE
jgi:hypothetical protein